MRLNSKLYDVLRDIAQVYLPASGTLYVTLAAIWGLPAAEQVGGTVLAIDTALGTVLKLSTSAFNKSDARFDGTLAIVDTEDDGSQLHLKNIDPVALNTQDHVTLRIVNQ